MLLDRRLNYRREKPPPQRVKQRADGDVLLVLATCAVILILVFAICVWLAAKR